MKIKSITPTNRFAEIEFREVIDDPVNKKVLTPSGFKPVLACEKIKTGPTVKLNHDGGELICDPHHRVMLYGGGEKYAGDLQPTDQLVGYHGEPVSCFKSDGQVEDLYDIEIDDPHWWYTSGVVSHNSVLLCNNAITSWKGLGPGGRQGQNVLLVTFELDYIKTAMRCLGALTHVPMTEFISHQEMIKRQIQAFKSTYNTDLCIYELPPEECSVNHIYSLIDSLKRTRGWRPDVVILDYLELMVSRVPEQNRDDYSRQKHVASEVRGLAKNENVLIFTATQTNRSGNDTSEIIDLNKAAESYGKTMSLDYIISLNQTEEERAASPPRLRFYIAKNRNGPKHEQVSCTIQYDTMLVKEIL